MTWLQRAALVLILLTAAVMRLTGVGWDDFQHHHPDERYIVWVATTIELPSINTTDWAAMWRPETSTFNPFHWPPEASSEGIVVLQGEPRDFAYGHLPLYMGVTATRLVEKIAPVLLPLMPPDWSLAADILNGAGRVEFNHLTAVGRALTALVDVGTVWIVFLLGRRLYSPAVGLVAAAYTAFAVLHIQLGHFFASDPYMTFFAVAAIYFMVMAHGGERDGTAVPVNRPRELYLGLAALMVGLAIGSKFAAILLVLPLLWSAGVTGDSRRRIKSILGVSIVAFLAFAITNPFALLDWTCQPLAADGPLAALTGALSRSCYLQNTMTQNAMVRGQSDLGFTRQYAGTIPYLYHLEMLVRWGLGPVIGLIAIGGLGWVVWTFAWPKAESPTKGRILTHLQKSPLTIVLLWVIPYFVLNGIFYVKFMRYMQPIVPFLLLFGSAMLWQLRPSKTRLIVIALSLVAAGIYAISFVSLYSSEHPWNAASRWIHQNVPPGSMILSEQWDDYLPVTMMVDGARRSRSEYKNAELTWLTYPDTADNEENLVANLELMAEADYLTILSNRVYGVIPRQPERFPLSSQYHQLLFDGALGYELVWVGDRTPELFGLSLRPDTFGWPGLRPPPGVRDYFNQTPAMSFGRVDESFVVYDQPLTMIFRNTGNYSVEQMRALFQTPLSNQDR